AASSDRELHAISFVGYAWRTRSGLTWDIGANYSVFTAPSRYDYPEVYVGVAFENVSARVSYAPRYLGRDSGAVYGEVNGVQPIFDRIRLFAHVGMLRTSGDDLYSGWTDYRIFDARAGIGFDAEPFHIQVGWVGISAANA